MQNSAIMPSGIVGLSPAVPSSQPLPLDEIPDGKSLAPSLLPDLQIFDQTVADDSIRWFKLLLKEAQNSLVEKPLLDFAQPETLPAQTVQHPSSNDNSASNHPLFELFSNHLYSYTDNLNYCPGT